MLYLPPHILSHGAGGDTLQQVNEAKAFRTWRAINDAQHRMLSILRYGRPDTGRSLEGRWLPE